MTTKEQWKLAQGQESIFWSVQNFPLLVEYEDYYGWFKEYIDAFDIEKVKVIDIGCGAVSYVPTLGFKTLFAYDSLIDQYLALDPSKTNLKANGIIGCKGTTESIPFPSNTFHVAFCLNMLDHTLDPEQSFKEIVRILDKDGALFFSCDIRTKPDDCHPHITSMYFFNKLIEDNNMFVIEERIIKHGEFQAFQALMKKEDR